MAGLPVVCVFGKPDVKLFSRKDVPVYEATELDCRCFPTDAGLIEIIARERPSVVVSIGDKGSFKELQNSPHAIRQMWMHFDADTDIGNAGVAVFEKYIQLATAVDVSQHPLVTVFTPAYKTGRKIMRPLNSLLAQTYTNWEWVVIDDSDDNGETFAMLTELANTDPRVRVYRECRHSGCIGALKKDACMLGRGKFLVELDHDDELTKNALDLVVRAFR
jgi:hypothetical protein